MRIKALFAAAALALCTTASGANATTLEFNGHVYHGSICKAYDGSDRGRSLNTESAEQAGFRYTSGGIQNPSDFNRWIICPLLRDENYDDEGTDGIFVTWSGSGTLTCTFFNRNSLGATVQSVSASTATPYMHLPDITYAGLNSTYTMTCSLPGGATLHQVSVEELM